MSYLCFIDWPKLLSDQKFMVYDRNPKVSRPISNNHISQFYLPFYTPKSKEDNTLVFESCFEAGNLSRVYLP